MYSQLSRRFSFLLMAATISLSSCFISSRSDLDVFSQSKYANDVTVKTVKVPMLLSKPIVKKYLRHEEDVPRRITNLVGNIKKVRVTTASSSNQNLVNDFRAAVQAYKGDEWMAVKHDGKFVNLKAEQDTDAVIRRMMVAVTDPDDNKMLFVNIKCHLTPDELSELINYAMNDDSPLSKKEKATTN